MFSVKEMNKKMKIFVLLFLALLGTTSTYATWDNLTNIQNEEVLISEGATIVLDSTVGVPSGKFLVPAGVVLGVNDLDEIVITYVFSGSKETLNNLDLSAVVSGAYANELNITTAWTNSDSQVNLGDTAELVITITLAEPLDQASYDALINSTQSFTVTITATEAQ